MGVKAKEAFSILLVGQFFKPPYQKRRGRSDYGSCAVNVQSRKVGAGALPVVVRAPYVFMAALGRKIRNSHDWEGRKGAGP